MFPFDLQAQPLAHALGRAILHSLWQGAAVAGLLAAALSLLRGRGANVRYALSCAALALMLLLPAATVWQVSGAAQESLAAEESATTGAKQAGKSGPDGGAVHADERAAVESRASSTRRADAFGIKSLLPWLSLVWLTGVAVLLARMLGGLVYARRLRRRGVSPVGEFWQERARDISRRLGLARAVRVLESTLVQVPTAVGWLRPVVLLPASALVGLTPQQLETILAHELAHIRRHDYLLNLLQIVAETLLFYHPAAWWVSRRVRAEREHVCDDLAVRVCGGDALAYARALTRMERLRRAPAPQVALAADGGNFTS
ncbi:MAG TPA: M56 family metallopeptidase, partial [Pyrinomonadaceae bacterium]|nr:M56 family metallopeptidase [Pyrinomonadaceae bacterium]